MRLRLYRIGELFYWTDSKGDTLRLAFGEGPEELPVEPWHLVGVPFLDFEADDPCVLVRGDWEELAQEVGQ